MLTDSESLGMAPEKSYFFFFKGVVVTLFLLFISQDINSLLNYNLHVKIPSGVQHSNLIILYVMRCLPQV